MPYLELCDQTTLCVAIIQLSMCEIVFGRVLSVYALQGMLGHSSLDMVKRYLSIAQADLQNVHRDASPVKNWCL